MRGRRLKCDIRMIKVDEIIRLLNIILLTGGIKGTRPVSAMIVSDIEMGKTEMLDVFRKMRNVVWANDLSMKPLISDVLPQLQQGKTHIIIPDLLTVLSHGRQVVKSVVSTLNMLIEEGISNLLFYGSERKFNEPVRAGIIFALTKGAYDCRRDYFESIGFASRCIPITFSYSDETIDEIHDYIADGSPVVRKVNISVSGNRKIDVTIEKKAEAKMIKLLALSKRSKSTGFRIHKHIRTLCKANALYYGRNSVSTGDVVDIERLLRFVNHDYTKL